ncbi:MAG: spore germination protein GerW family protein [Thermoleophilia bacterium]
MNENAPDPALDPSIPYKNFLDRMAERVGSNARAEAVYGAPVERDGVTVIPVAKVRWGFGGGDGTSAGDGATHGAGGGSGGGGGVTVSPLGYIEIAEGESRFRRIADPAALAPVVLAGGFVAWLLLRGVRKAAKTIANRD